MIINWGDTPIKAFITVTYPSGSCTCTNGTKTYTHTGGGTYTFTVNKKGTWTVKATDANGITSSGSVEISGSGQSRSITLSYLLNIVSGNAVHSVCGGLAALKLQTNKYEDGQVPTVSYPSGSVQIVGLGGESYGAGIVYTKNKINLAGYKTLRISGVMETDSKSSGYSTMGVLAATPTATSVSFSVSSQFKPGTTAAYTINGSVDVSSLTGTYHLCLSRYFRKVTVNISSMVLE